MSNDLDLLEEEIKSRLINYEVCPPSEIWSSIIKERSFGHVSCNRIMQNYYLFSLLAFLTIGGIYLFSQDAEAVSEYSPLPLPGNFVQAKLILGPNTRSNSKELRTSTETISSKNTKKNIFKMPLQDETAAISTRSSLISTSLFKATELAKILRNEKSIPIAEPFELISYKHLEKLRSKSFHLSNEYIRLKRMGEVENLNNNFSSKRGIALLFTAGPEFISKSFQLEYFISSEYAEKRKKYVRSRKAYTFSTRLDYQMSKKGFLEFGVDFTRIAETSIMDNKSLSSEFTFISIPVLYGYQNNYGRLGWEIKGGLSYQLLNFYRGEILGADGIEILELGDPSENPYKLSGVVNLHIATGLSYSYTEDIKILLEPYYKRSINSISRQTVAFSERIQYMGLNVGVKYDF